ncbi:class I SAM-dependent methyltransferase [Mesorhizobium sp. ZC-5]|uniref:class I SAM-dependent methyltransferase n=1 Tax=Mesorhizobium sp. ZC-5 TaxID=2986066 RepID=UPI0021E7C28F|nr:class I SAM-dependent methyltransferase [Mesorhizobium sp. ZC-5]MCV3240180.1 class I SAM-dependent methyltransferase [Mesorhizobium sp. ZC-5]
MAAKDPTTLAFYATEAEAYADRQGGVDDARLDPFLAKLPVGAAILELGCGGGQDSQAMLARGFDVTPTDGSAELAHEAEKRLGRPVRVLLFGHLEEKDNYDGVWANACLLHVPRRDLPGIIERIHAALRPRGVFYASFKAGSREGRDRFQRYYNYPSPEWLREVYGAFQWDSVEIEADIGSGYDREPTNWLHVTALKASGMA